MLGSHSEDLRGTEWFFVEPRLRVQVFHEPHLLQHISIVIQTGFVDAQGDRNTSCDELPHRRDSTSQSKIRTGVVTDTNTVLGDDVEIGFPHPRAAADGRM